MLRIPIAALALAAGPALAHDGDPVPLPTPERAAPTESAAPQGRLVIRDLTTGATIYRDSVAAAAPGPRIAPGNAGAFRDAEDFADDLDDPFDADGVSGSSEWDMRLIRNPRRVRWSPNCRIIAFSGNTVSQASGVLIDPYHVLTAGHVIHDGPGGGFADAVSVQPAFDRGDTPFGTASAVSLVTFEGWIDDGDFGHDMGLIELDRPVGVLSGWYGYASEGDCMLDANWHNTGYPGANPFNGRRLYRRNGTLFDCTGLEIEFRTMSWAGQSGGPVFQNSPVERIVHSVFTSTSHQNSRSYGVRFTAAKFDTIADAIDLRRGNVVDLAALDVRARRRVVAGRRLRDLDFLVHNYSQQAFNGTVTADLYLSDDSRIRTNDTFLKRVNWTGAIGELETIVIAAAPRIGAGTPPGTYWVGAILVIDDADPLNDRATGDDAVEIIVRAPAGAFAPPFEPCSADFDDDGFVDHDDLARLVEAWGKPAPFEDLDRDGTVGAGDLILLLGAWGECRGVDQ